MAVDTRAKRMSASQILMPFYLDIVVPDGAIGQSDRQAVAWSYSGIVVTFTAIIIYYLGERFQISALGDRYGIFLSPERFKNTSIGDRYKSDQLPDRYSVVVLK